MKKMVLLLCVLGLLGAGCEKLESDYDQGWIEISGSRADVRPTIRKMIEARGWRHEQTGSRSVREKRGGKNHYVSKSWVYARTQDGNQVFFDVEKRKGEPTTIQVSTTPDAKVNTALITEDLSRRLQNKLHPRRRTGPLEVEITELEPPHEDPDQWMGHWEAKGDWEQTYGHIQLVIRSLDQSYRKQGVDLGCPLLKKGAPKEGMVDFEYSRHAGSLVFHGTREGNYGSGRVIFEPNEVYLAELSELLDQEISRRDCMDQFFANLKLSYARAMVTAMGGGCSFEDLTWLSNYRVSPEFVAGCREVGCSFSTGDYIKLTSYRVPLEKVTGFKEADYNFSAKELVKIQSYRLNVDDFVGFREAGYDFTVAEMIKANSYRVSAKGARKLHEAGCEFDLEDLIKLQSYRVDPDFIISFKEGGYEFDREDIIKANSYRVSADDAVKLKNAGYKLSLGDLIKLKNYRISTNSAVQYRKTGYDFSVEDLIKLSQYRVSSNYILDVYSPDHEPFTAQELVDLSRKGIKSSTIVKMRKVKPRETED